LQTRPRRQVAKSRLCIDVSEQYYFAKRYRERSKKKEKGNGTKINKNKREGKGGDPSPSLIESKKTEVCNADPNTVQEKATIIRTLTK